MKNTSRKPYIYKVANLETHQYYIGSQCSGKTVGVNYFTSSTNKAFKEGFKTYREEKYKIEIIKEFEDPKKCVRAENYLIRDHMLLKDGLCLNRACCCNGEKIFSTVGTHPSEETRKKLSIAKKGRQAWNKGLPGWNNGLPGWNKGVPWSEETKQKMSLAQKSRIKVSINDAVFESLTEASKYYNVGRTTIKCWIKKNQHNAFYVEK